MSSRKGAIVFPGLEGSPNKEGTRPSISLLHATWFSPRGPLVHRNEWLSAAANPEEIEYVPAMDADDVMAIQDTSGFRRFVGPVDSSSGFSTAVRNWNGAAKLATGKVLFVISDDLFPTPNWDKLVLEKLSGLQPEADSFVLKIRDTPHHRDWRVSHPIISREYYRTFGLFCAEYTHLRVDLDFTMFAFWNSVIFDGRDIVFRHDHPSFNPKIFPNASQRKGNREIEEVRGREVFARRWTLRERVTRVRFVTPTAEVVRNDKWLERRNSLRTRASRLFLYDLTLYIGEKLARRLYWILVGQVKASVRKRRR